MARSLKQPEFDKVEVSSSLLAAISHPVRLKILEFIDKNQRIQVNSIYNTLQLEQSITSQHLRVLREHGVVESTKEGKFNIYCINYKILGKAKAAIAAFSASDEEHTDQN